jgi:hypothetical protein
MQLRNINNINWRTCCETPACRIPFDTPLEPLWLRSPPPFVRLVTPPAGNQHVNGGNNRQKPDAGQQVGYEHHLNRLSHGHLARHR